MVPVELHPIADVAHGGNHVGRSAILTGAQVDLGGEDRAMAGDPCQPLATCAHRSPQRLVMVVLPQLLVTLTKTERNQ